MLDVFPRCRSKLVSSAAALLFLGLGCNASEQPATNEPLSETGETEASGAAVQAAEPADPESFPDVVATVNGTEIHKEELIDRAESIEAQAQGAIETSSLDFYRRVLNDLVGAELLYQESKDKGLEASSEDVDQQLESIKSRLPDEASFEQALLSEGLTIEGLRAQIQRDMSIQRFIDETIASNIDISEAEMRRFYDENTDQLRMPERLRVSHILKRVPPDASPEAREAARREISEIREQAASGGDFAALAREHSDDPGSAQSGGELVISRGQTVPPFEEAAFALEPGELSSVVETQFGFHVIKLSERMDGTLVPYEEAQGRIEQFLSQQALQSRLESTVAALRESGSVETFI